jgi:hypothetical protein
MEWAHRLRVAGKRVGMLHACPDCMLHACPDCLCRFRIDALEERHEARWAQAGGAG